MELLAPAGDWDALVAAVQNGANAVYLGTKRFGARQNAANFEGEVLAKAVEYAHLRGVKVYATVNTLVKDEEMKEALSLLAELYGLGVDAVIVQDLGLVHLARELIPGLPLHASTQMTVHNSAGVKAAAARGLKRIVLARELSLEELQTIRRETEQELECFVHGALCISYSGQCLMSSMIGGRSGNRGRCAQPCRLEYELVDARGNTVPEGTRAGSHLLSPRDLNLSRYLPQLMAAGVTSLKIEGRMKRPEYVATVVRVYREALNRMAAGVQELLTEKMEQDLWQIFNRGFTSAYFLDNPGVELMSHQRPNNRGIYLGRIQEYSSARRTMTLKLESPLREGDGLEIWVTRGGRVGLVAGRFFGPGGEATDRAGAGERVEIPVQQRVYPGDRVFKTHDRDLMEEAQASFRSPREKLEIPLQAAVWAEPGQPLRLRLTDPEGRTGEGVTAFVAQEALKRPLDEVTLREQLNRFGNTPFTLGEMEVHLQGRVMVPFSEINDARRKAVEELMQQRLSHGAPSRAGAAEAEKSVRDFVWPPARSVSRRKRRESPFLSVTVSGRDTALAALAAGANRLYLGGERFRPGPGTASYTGGPWVSEVIAEAHRQGTEVIFNLPRISRSEEIAALKHLFPWEEGDGILVGNLGLWQEFKDQGRPVFLDHPLYTFNQAAAMAAAHWGAAGVTASLELRQEELAILGEGSPLPVEAVVHGRLTLMVSAHCVAGSVVGGRGPGKACTVPCAKEAYGLKDRMGLVFPMAMDAGCRAHIYNPMELCLVDRLPELAEMSLASLRVEAQGRPAEYVTRVVEIYRQGLDETIRLSREQASGDLARMREELAALSPQGLTRGHFHRGVE